MDKRSANSTTPPQPPVVTLAGVMGSMLGSAAKNLGLNPSEHDVKLKQKMKERAKRTNKLAELQKTNEQDQTIIKAEREKLATSPQPDSFVNAEVNNVVAPSSSTSTFSRLFGAVRGQLDPLKIPPNEEANTAISPNPPPIRGSIISMATGLLGIGGPLSDSPQLSEKKPKTPQDLEREHWEKIYQEQRDAEERERAEQERLDAEPRAAKNLRKVFNTIDDVLLLLEGVFQDARFLPAGYTLEESCELLALELQQNPENEASYERFSTLSHVEPTDTLFNKLDKWHAQFEELSNLWQEVFCYYTMPSSRNYSFSLQPVFKLHFFYQTLDEFTKSKLKAEFHAFMIDVNSEITLEQKMTMEIFVEIVELFAAKVVILHQMLDQFQRHIENITDLSGRQNIQFREITDEENIADVRDINDAEISEDIIAERNRANDVFNEFTQKVDVITRAIAGYKEQLAAIEAFNSLIIDEVMAKELDKGEFKAKKVQQIFDGKLEIDDEATARLQGVLKAIVEGRLKVEIEKIEVVKPQFHQAKTELTAAAQAVIDAKRAVIREKCEAEEDRNTAAEALQQGHELLQEHKQQALIQVKQFFTEYAARPDSQGKLMLSGPIQASLSDVNPDMLQLWLYDYGQHLNTETLDWIKTLITHKLRTLDVAVTISVDGVVEIALQDTQHEMLGKFYISVNGSSHGTLISSPDQSIFKKILADYTQALSKSSLKGVSDGKVRISNLLDAIRQSDQEYRAHAQLPHMSQATIALFGLYVLLSNTLPKRGSRFRTSLLKILESDSGYDLTACDAIYAELSRQLVEDIEATTRASQFMTRASIVASLSSPSSTRVTEVLEYIFAEYRTEADLATNGSYPYKGIKLSELRDCDALVQELKKSRYMSELEKLIRIPDSDDVRYADESMRKETRRQHDIGRKRMKRLAELLNQLPQKNRLELIIYPVIQLMMIKAQIIQYQRELSGEKSSGFGTFAARMKNAVRGSILMQEQTRAKLLRAICEDIDYMYIAQQTPATTNLKRHVLLDAYRKSLDIAAWQEYESKVMDKLKEKHEAVIQEDVIKELFPDKDVQSVSQLSPEDVQKFSAAVDRKFIEYTLQQLVLNDMENILSWYDKSIGNAKEIIQISGWLRNDQLQFVFAIFGEFAAQKIKELREKNGDIIEAFDSFIVDDRNDNKEKQMSIMDINSINQMTVFLACQSTILTFGAQIQNTENNQLIVEASRYNWFLQLCFLAEILVQQELLPEYKEGYDASINRIKERNMLKVFDKLIAHHANLATWIKEGFGKGRQDIIDKINGKSGAELEKAVYHLIVLFFNILFTQESAIAASKGRSNDARFLLMLANHFGHIASMMGMRVDDEHKAVLFGMAVYLLSAHSEELLTNSSIKVLGTTEAGSSNLQVFKHSQNASIASGFYSTTQGIEIKKQNTEVHSIFSSDGAEFFVESMRFNSRAEEIGLQCAVALHNK